MSKSYGRLYIETAGEIKLKLTGRLFFCLLLGGGEEEVVLQLFSQSPISNVGSSETGELGEETVKILYSKGLI